METELNDAYRALAYDAADQMEMNFDDLDEQPMSEFAESASAGSISAQ